MSVILPTEICNLAAQNRFHVSFDALEYTVNVDAVGVLRVLEAILHQPSGEGLDDVEEKVYTHTFKQD